MTCVGSVEAAGRAWPDKTLVRAHLHLLCATRSHLLAVVQYEAYKGTEAVLDDYTRPDRVLLLTFSVTSRDSLERARQLYQRVCVPAASRAAHRHQMRLAGV